MDLKKINNKEYLKKLSTGSVQELNEMIDKTHGFVLYLMQINSIIPDKDKIMGDIKNINLLSLNFLLKNYTLNKQEKAVISKYFYNVSNVLSVDDLDVNDFLERVKNYDSLPEDYLLDYDIIYNNQIVLNESEDNTLVSILKNSCSRYSFTKEQILSLTELDDYYLLEILNKKHYLSEPQLKQRYLNILLKSVGHRNIDVQDLKNISFTQEDKAVVNKLAKHFVRHIEYEKIKSIDGLGALVSAVDCTKSNLKNLKFVEMNEENIKELRKSFSFSSILNNCEIEDEEQMQRVELLIDDELIKEYLQSKNGVLASLSHSFAFEKDNINLKQSLLLKKILTYLDNNPIKEDDIYYIQEFINKAFRNEYELGVEYTKSIREKLSIKLLEINNEKNAYLDNNKFYFHVLPYQEAIMSCGIFDGMNIQKYYFLKNIQYSSKQESLLGKAFHEQKEIAKQFFEFLENAPIPNEHKIYVNNFFNKELDIFKKGNYIKSMNLDLSNLSNSDFIRYVLTNEENAFKAIEGQKLNQNFFLVLINMYSEQEKDKLVSFIKNYEKNYGLTDEEQNIIRQSIISDSIFSTQDNNEKCWNLYITKATDNIDEITKPYLFEKINDLFLQKDYDNVYRLLTLKTNNFHYLIKEAVKDNIFKFDIEQLLEICKNENFKTYILGDWYNFKKMQVHCDKEQVLKLVDLLSEKKDKDILKEINYIVKNKEIIKDVIIEKDPVSVFYTFYDFDFEVDDLIKAYKNIQSRGIDIFKFSSDKDSLSYDLYRKTDNSKEQLERTLKSLEVYPELYTLLAPFVALNIESKDSENTKDKTRSFVEHNAFINYCNYDIYFEGVNILVNKLSQKGANKTLIRKTLRSTIGSTYYFTYPPGQNEVRGSFLDEQKSFNIAQNIFVHDILLFTSVSAIGSLEIDQKLFNTLFDKYNLPILDLMSLDLGEVYKESYKDLFQYTVGNCIKNADDLSLSYIQYMGEQINFFEKLKRLDIEDSNSVVDKLMRDNIYTFLGQEYEDNEDIKQIKDKLKLFETKFFLSQTLIDDKITKKKANKI